jgi:hypothetical protein
MGGPERHFGIAAQMSHLRGGLRGADQWRRHIDCKRVQAADSAAAFEHHNFVLPDVVAIAAVGFAEPAFVTGRHGLSINEITTK